MGLVMVCPQCQAKVLMQSESCQYCQADLRNVPPDRRRYLSGEEPGPSTPPPAPEPAAIPVLESAGVPKVAGADIKVRRPHVRRFAAPPVAESHPPVLQPAVATQSSGSPAEAVEVKIRRPHVRRYAAPPVSETHPVAAQPAKASKAKPEAKKAKKPKPPAKKKK